MKDRKKWILPLMRGLFAGILGLGAGALTLGLLLWGVLFVGTPGKTPEKEPVNLNIMDHFDLQVSDPIRSAREDALALEKIFWLKDTDLIAPEPDQAKFGTAPDAPSMQGFLEEAQDLLQGQTTYFTPDVKTYMDEEIIYYLDETIMVITWREIRHHCVYTFSEVKISHPSQLRRYVADGVFGSENEYITSQMAQTVNAVTASSGDYYMYREYGILVYEGQVMQFNNRIDTCYITDKGEMLFTRPGELETWEEAQKFVDDNHIRFSLAFGPVLIENYEKVAPKWYLLGEITGKYSRSALAVWDDLHYLLVVCNEGDNNDNIWKPTTSTFADQLVQMGVKTAYSLDGGQTSVIVTNDELINRPTYGFQRLVSDIIYFATAVPNSASEGGEKNE